MIRRSSEDEPARSRILIDSALHRTKHTRDLLPLIKQHRLAQTSKRDVGIRAKATASASRSSRTTLSACRFAVVVLPVARGPVTDTAGTAPITAPKAASTMRVRHDATQSYYLSGPRIDAVLDHS